jgi:PAS domain S-box-containing protein
MKEKQLKENNKWKIFDYFADAVYVTSYNDVFLYVNDESCRLWGRKKEEIVGYPIFIVFPQAKGTVLEEKRKECLDSGKALISEFYFPSPPFEGWYEINHTPCPDGIITRFKPILEKQKASQSIDFLYELISMFLKQLQEPIVILDLRFKVKESNDFLLKFTGVTSKSAIIGKDFFSLFCPEYAENLKPIFGEVFKFNKSLEVEVGNLKLKISTILDYFDHPLYYIVFLSREEKTTKVEESFTHANPLFLIDSKEKGMIQKSASNFYYQLWNQSGVPTAVFDKKGDLITVNDSMNELFSNQINLKYNLLSDPQISASSLQKIQSNQFIHVERHFKPEEARYFFLNKTFSIREEYYLDIFVKPFFGKTKLDTQGYILKLIDRLEYKKKKDLHKQMLEKMIDDLKTKADELKDLIHSHLLLINNTEDKLHFTQRSKNYN